MDTWHSIPAPTAEDSSSDQISVSSTSTEPEKSSSRLSRHQGQAQGRRRGRPRRTNAPANNLINFTHPENNNKNSGLPPPPDSSNQKYSCSICFKEFTALPSVQRHELTHTENAKQFSCDMCGRKFTQSSSLNTHKRVIHQGEKLFTCQICAKSFGKNNGLQCHLKAHAKKTIDLKGNRQQEKYSCSACPATFFSYQYQIFVDHLQTIHGITHNDIQQDTQDCSIDIVDNSQRYSCSCCSRRFSSLARCRRHEELKHTEKSGEAFSCDLCDSNFSHLILLKTHKRVQHGDTSKEFRCLYCAVTLSSPQRLAAHVKEAHGVGYSEVEAQLKKYSCSICPMKYRKRYELNVHLKCHRIRIQQLKEQRAAAAQVVPLTPVTKNAYLVGESISMKSTESKIEIIKKYDPTVQLPTCSTCGKEFLSVKQVTLHKTLHDGIRYHCPVCGKEFLREEGLKSHQTKAIRCTTRETTTARRKRVKNNESRPYTKYDKTEILPDNIMISISEETGKQVYACSLCSETTRNLAKAGIHSVGHAGHARVFKCDLCPTRFTQDTSLRTHKYRKHGVRGGRGGGGEEEGTSEPPVPKFDCPVCGKKFWRKYALGRHVTSHENKTVDESGKPANNSALVYQCPTCPSEFTSGQVFTFHVQEEHGVKDPKIDMIRKMYMCKFCCQKYQGRNEFEEHLKSHKDDKEKPAEDEGLAATTNQTEVKWVWRGAPVKKTFANCPTCSRTYNARYLRYHQIQCAAAARKDRSLNRGKNIVKKKKKKSTMKESSESSSESDDDEFEEEEQEKEQEGRPALLPGRLGDLLKRVECPHCQKSMPKVHLNHHIRRTHLGLSRFSSRFCHLTFVTQVACLRHEKIHEKEGICRSGKVKIRQCSICTSGKSESAPASGPPVVFPTAYLANQHFMEKHNRQLTIPIQKLEIKPLTLNPDQRQDVGLGDWALCGPCGNYYTTADYRLHQALCGDQPRVTMPWSFTRGEQAATSSSSASGVFKRSGKRGRPRKRVEAVADLQSKAEDVVNVKVEAEEVEDGIGGFDWMMADADDNDFNHFPAGLIGHDLNLNPLLENANPAPQAVNVTQALSEDDEILKTLTEVEVKTEVPEQVQTMLKSVEEERLEEVDREQECPLCGLTFKNMLEFLAHDSLEHKRGAISLIRMSFKSLQDEPEYHSQCFHGISVLQASKDTLHIPWYTCEKCGKSSKLKSQILGHKRVALAATDTCPPTQLDGIFKPKLISNDPRIKVLDNGNAQCTICDKIYANVYIVKKHLPVHEGKFVCPYCGRNLSGNATYQDHLSTHTGEKRYKCDKCDKAYRSAPMLFIHKRSAHENRIYECDLCPYSGKYEPFYHHVKKHHPNSSSSIKFRKTTKLVVERETVVPSILACDRCPNIFKSRHKLAHHLATVHGQDERQVAAAGIHKPSGYPCEHCGKVIADKNGLKRHIVVFHRTDGLKLKFFRCKLCQKEYSLITSMRHHLRSAHAQEIPTELLEQELAHGEDPEGKSTVLDIENYFVRLKPPLNN